MNKQIKGIMMCRRSFIVILLLFLSNFIPLSARHPVYDVDKVVIWAYKLGSHTHAWIHWGFDRAFKHMGFKTYWFDDRDNVSNFDFSNSLFLTMGATDNHRMPVRDDCFYIIHNGHAPKYTHLVNKGRCVFLQVYTHDCLERGDTQIEYCFHYSLKDATLYMPWATDLLPHEIDKIKESIPNINKKRRAMFVGSVWGNNQDEINQFKRGCAQQGIPFEAPRTNGMEENIKLIQESLIAPAVQGKWQCDKGYIPCRIFKNISYGAMGITNSSVVYNLFDKKIIYHPDASQLCKASLEQIGNFTIQDQYALMDLVRDKHTYINRVERLLEFFEQVANSKNLSRI